MKRCIICLLLFLPLFLPAQEITQTIRGSIMDQDSRSPLIGATVAVYQDSALITGGTSDPMGVYRIDAVPVGRYTLVASFVGYDSRWYSDVIVNSGKEFILNIQLEEAAFEMEAVEVTGKRKGDVLNEMASVSARPFSVEETQKYAGSRADPARMASNFAGVQGSNDESNDLVIRGNTPFGVLWRMENLNIPNPNHFAVAGNTGGPVAILNNKYLSNSDFFTGAFPAEYGNSIAGVFDVNMRNGNNEKYEFSGQFGFLGTELFAEGPINRASRSSFLASYRYSTLALFDFMNINIGTDAVPQYQDGAFKINLPGRNGKSNLSFFGIGGKSHLDVWESKKVEIDTSQLYTDPGFDEHFGSGMAAVGMNYMRSANESTYYNIAVGVSHAYSLNAMDSVDRHEENNEWVVDGLYDYTNYYFEEMKVSGSFIINNKLTSRSKLKSGIFADGYRVNYADSTIRFNQGQWLVRLDQEENFLLLQPFVQWKYAVSDKVTFHAGLHGQYLTLTKSKALEPRAGVKWQAHPKHAFSLGAGMHSQMIPIYMYFPVKYENGTPNQPNIDLDFMRSIHTVAGYNWNIGNYLRFRTEAYYQYLYDIPIEEQSSSYSIINEGGELDRVFPNKLANDGIGRNIGLEATLEKFFHHNYFFMITASIYDSKYLASDGNWYNSVFNGNYAANLLGTKEFVWGDKTKQRFGIGGKITVAGGRRYTPVNMDTSSEFTTIYIDSLRNSEQFKDYFRFDIKANYILNARKVTHEFGLDIVNVLNTENILKVTYVSDPQNPLRYHPQLGRLPIFYYKIDF